MGDSEAKLTVLRDWVRGDAAALAARLERRDVPRAERSQARALLSAAFTALNDPDDAALQAVSVALDRAAWAGTGHGCRGLAARIGLRRFRGAARPDFYERVFDYERVADTLSARIDRFVAATGGQPPRLFMRPVSAADPRAVPEVDMSLTTG
jgi:hypothetical protein